uniref:Hemicentin-1-like n=1 Tax=Seriola lalandi dorsalis TaxID=1841481 RepID=A0A3B4XL25_SERLL
MTGVLFKCLVALYISTHRLLAVPRVEEDDGSGDSASTLAFVFDVTGSMYDDLKQVIEGASRILEKTLNRRTRPIKNFVLVPFHDPDIGPVSITTDPKKFQQDLQELFVQGGGDCPEMSIGAIKKALEVSLPGSFIYVFTDARAKDYRLKRDVLQLVQLRQSQVVFVLTGDCGDRSQPGYRVYEEIAATSSGQIFHLDKQQVNEVLKWVEETVQAMKVHLLSSNHDSAQENKWEVPFDPSLREVTVSLSGPAPQIELSDPFGRVVGVEQGLKELLNIPNSARVVNLKFPRPGAWKLKVSCSGRHTLRVTGVSNLDFRAGFSGVPVSEFNHTRERPIKGLPAHVLLKCTGLKPPGQLSHVELMSGSGRSLRTIPVPLPADLGEQGLWSLPEFRIPSQSFFIKVTGKDEEGYRFQRLSSVSYTNIVPDPPAVSMPDVVKGFYMQPAVIGCSVESDIPYRLRFSRSGITLGEEKFFQNSAIASWEIAHASVEDEGLYECTAQSTAGQGRALTQLTVREPPPVLKPAVNVTSAVGGVAVLPCKVEGSMRHNLTWHRAGRTIRARAGRVKLLSDTSLQINGVRTQDAGEYHCVATNAHGDSRITVWLLVPEAPSVVVHPQSQAFSRGDEIRLVCSASGSPPPKLFWSHGNMFLTNQPRVSLNHNGVLIIRGALPEDAGNYTCLATNEAGTASQSVSITFAEVPKITVARQVVLVSVGGDATLECQATGVPSPLVRWFKGELEVGSAPFVEQDVHRGTLHIRGVQEVDAGQYSCVASSSAGTSAGTVTLEVGAGPLFSEAPVDVAANVGENITLPCVARGFPQPTVTWRRQDGRQILTRTDSHSRTTQLENGHLLIQSVWLDDEGLYICEAKNQFGSSKTEARVSVTGLEPPVLAQGAPIIATGIGQSLSIPCMLLDGIPLPERHWSQNGKPVRMLNGRMFLRSDGSLYIERTIPEDAGTYVCTAVNVAGSMNITVTLEVHVPPEINAGPYHYIANEGVAITLSCEASGVPKPNVVWSKGRQPLLRDHSSLKLNPDGYLHIPHPTADDAGIYICTATSPVGYASREIQLSVNSKIMGVSGHDNTVKMAAEVGTEVVLPCEAQGSPSPLVTWSRNGHPIPPVTAGFTVLPSGSLKITDVRLIDSKLYTCTAENPAGNMSISYNLHIQAKPRIQTAPSLLKALIGQTVILPCVVQGEPSPEVSWFHNGLPVGVKNTTPLRIQQVSLADQGTYQCVARNSAGQETLEIKLEILEAPSFAEPGDAIMEKVANSKVIIPCPAEGSPRPKVRWFKNGLEIHAEQSEFSVARDGALVISTASASHSGDFKCMATNEAGSVERKTRLKVNVPPEIQDDSQPLNLTVTLKQPLTLGCDAFGIPSPTITWTKDGHPVNSPGVYLQNGNRMLRIYRVQPDHAGQFTCTAQNSAGEARREYNIVVQAPPVISGTSRLQELTVVLGQEVEFQCRVSGKPPPRVEWSRDGEVLSRDGDPHVEFLEDGQVLKVKSVRLRDQGLYQCLASNNAGTQMRQFRLTVQAPPTIKGPSETSEVSVVLGFPTVLPCDVEGSPTPSITWLKDNQPIVSSPQLTYTHGGQALRLGSARGDSTGLYTCRATNPAGTAIKHYSLSVLVPPQIEGDSTSLTFGGQEEKVRINGSLTLSCLAKGFPEPNVNWFKDGQLLTGNFHAGIQESGHFLHIDNAMLSHEGQYTCVVTNSAGEDKRDFHVTIQVPPVFHRVTNREAAWGLGHEGDSNNEDMVEKREVVLGHPISLSCESNAIPPPKLSWYKDGRKLTSADGVELLPGGQVLQIARVQKEDAGKYTCQAVNEAGEDHMHFELEILVPPVIMGASEEFMEEMGAVVNSTVVLHCDVTGHPAPVISWLRDGQPVHTDSQHHISKDGTQLQVSLVQVSDMAGYLCVAENKVGTVEKLFSLTVQVPPRIIGSKEEEVSVIEGHMVSLLCDVQAYPPPDITWTRDGQVNSFGTGINILPGGQMLQLSRARLEDAGQYVCTATNSAGQDQKTILLSVYGKQTVTHLHNSSTYVYTDEKILKDCLGKRSVYLNVTPDGSTLTLLRLSPEDSGTYTCLAVSPVGQESKFYTLFVLVPPSISGETTVPREVQVTQDSAVTLECQAAGNPPPQISWLKNGRPLLLSPRARLLSGDSVLRISPVQLSDSGVYTCVARSRAGLAELSYDVQVQVPPGVDHVEPVEPVTVVQGSLVTLTCEARGVPPPTLTWMKDSQPLSLHRNLLLDGQETRLQLPDVAPSDAGLYSCVASNQAGSSTKSFNLTVLVVVSLNSPEELTIAANSPLELECSAVGVPPPTLSWLKDGRPLEGTDIVQQDGHFVRISKIQVEDAGLYTCLASSPAGEDGKNHWVRVQVPPTLLGSGDARTLTVPVNGHLTLECLADSDPPPNIEWYKDEAKLQPGGRIQRLAGGQYLEIQEVRPEDSGQYSCVVTNMAGSTSLFFTVEILLPPVIKESGSLVTAHVGQEAVLPCEVEGDSSPTVMWRKDGFPVSQDNNKYMLSEGSLHIHGVQLSDAGRYYCTVSNQAGSDHRGMDLRVFVGPSISPGPFNVTVSAGIRAVLSCETTGIPPPKVSWKRNGTPLDISQLPGAYRILPSGSLVLLSPSSEDEGYFECTAVNDVGEERRVIEVIVQVPPSIEDDATTVTAVKMSPVVLPCHVQGRPQPTITWTKGGAKLGARGGSYRVLPTGVLEITAAVPSHAGRYTCSARNPAGVAHKHITLTVQEPPEIRPMAEEVQVVLHHGTVLPCEVQGLPRPSITWQREGVPIAAGHRLAVLSNGALKFSRVTLGDAGTYQCLAKNDAGVAVGRTKLVLQGKAVVSPCLFLLMKLYSLFLAFITKIIPPVLSAPRVEYTAVLGQSVSLECVADGQPQPEVTWHKERRPVVDSAHIRIFANGTLAITSTQRSDAGLYTCTAKNLAGRASQDMRLVIQGEISTAFKCQHQPCYAQIHWTLLIKNVPGATVDEAGRSAIIIDNVTVSDAGTYMCIAENSVGSIRALSFVRIREPPVLKGEAHMSQTVIHGGSAILDCPVQGDPSPVLRWLRDGKPLHRSLRLQALHNGSLVIYSITAADEGEYQCVAESEAGTAERAITLKVQINGGYSNWQEWSPCSSTCGQGFQERIRLCNNPEPANGGRSCSGPSIDSRKCHAGLCPGETPRKTRGSLIGMVNEREFGVSFLEANITDNEEEGSSTLQARLDNIPPSVGPLLRVLVSVFAPIYWTTVLQSREARNGYSLTQGQFRQESQLEFETGEILRLTHVARGLDSEGVLLIDIVINGFVPPSLTSSHLSLQEFDESYVQTGQGQLYSWSSQTHQRGGNPMVLRCNHTIIYEGQEEREGPLLQLLKVSGMNSVYNMFTLTLDFHVTASLLIPDGYGDTCPKGFILDTASYCADEDECALQSPCSHSCNNIMGGFSCACPSGFTISTDTNTCQDIDECSQGSHMCHYNQQCVNTVGTYRCQAKCGPGFKPSITGTSCEDVDECQESALSPCQHQCLNTLGSYRCICHPGYQLSGHRCIDINECMRNVCPAHQQCRNTEGGYQCFDSCPAGMTKAESGACMDIDECQDGSHMCRYTQICQNTVGGYGCVCPRGYRSQGVGLPCLDIDECLQTPNPCAYQCRNVPGSFRCLCPPGTVLLGDGRSCAGLERGQTFTNGTRVRARLRPQLVSSLGRPILSRSHGASRITRQSCPVGYTNRDGKCVDVDECLLRKPCQHECRNTIGSFQCTCPPGYQLLPNGRSCKDIDECAEQGIQCGHNQMCFNTRGGYQCLDTPCPASYQSGGSPGTCYRPCSLDCATGGSPLLLQYKLLTLPSGIPANHNVVRLSAFSESGILQERTSFTILEQESETGVMGRVFGIRDEAGRGIIFTLRALDRSGLVRLKVQATTISLQGRITYQSIFIIYISISSYPY